MELHWPAPSAACWQRAGPASNIPTEEKQETWKLKTARCGGEGPPCNTWQLQGVQGLSTLLFLITNTGKPGEVWGTHWLAPQPLVLHPVMVEVGTSVVVLVSTWV